MATGPTPNAPFSIGQHPFSIGNAYGVSQFSMPSITPPGVPTQATPPTGGDLPGFRQ